MPKMITSFSCRNTIERVFAAKALFVDTVFSIFGTCGANILHGFTKDSSINRKSKAIY